MSNYKKIAEAALKKSKLIDTKINVKPTLNEDIVYLDGISERMHPQLEKELAERKHSLGTHPILPEGDENHFEQRIMGKRFSEVVNRYKRAFDCDTVDQTKLMMEMMPLLQETMMMESKHTKELEKLAEQMIRDEYDMPDDIVEIRATLTPKINMEGTKKNPTPKATENTFKNHDAIVSANEEVYKRRFLNAMIQGAAKKCSHMFHSVDEELTNMEPTLVNRYTKLMAAADYMYYVIPNMENGVNGGVVKVTFPTKDNPKAIIEAEAMVFPVLIHELVKGVMELLSAHGLPKEKEIGDYVISKADFLAAEPWDMRIGPALWEQFTDAIDGDDFSNKHHIYTELVSLPVREFNIKMREIMAGTEEGKKIVKEIADSVKSELKEDEFTDAMNEINSFDEEEKSFFNINDLLDEDEDDVFGIEDIFK